MTNIQKVLLVTALSIAGYAIWIFVSGYDEVADGMSRVGMSGILIITLLSLLNYALRFLRWHWMLYEVTQKKVPIVLHMQCYIAGFALTATPGKVGEALRSYYLKPYGVRVSDSLAALFSERLFDLIAILIIGALAFIQFDSYRWVGYIVLLLVVAAALLLKTNFFVILLSHVKSKIKNQKLRDAITHLTSMVESTANFMTWRLWGGGLILGVAAWGAEAWGFALLVKWLSGEDQILIASGIYALSMLIGAVSFLPGGIGGAEVTMAALLVAIGMSLADATVATIVCRVLTLWLAVFLGLLVMLKFQLLPTQRLSEE